VISEPGIFEASLMIATIGRVWAWLDTNNTHGSSGGSMHRARTPTLFGESPSATLARRFSRWMP